MYNLKIIFDFIGYKIFSKHRKGFGIHSPFLYEFVTEVLYSKKNQSEFNQIENIREQLKQSNQILEVNDLGAGYKKFKEKKRSVKEIVKRSAVKKKYGRLLYHTVSNYRMKNILELGTSLGIGTSYLAKANPKANVITVEACRQTAEKASENFKQLGLNNIDLIIGGFDEVLPHILKRAENLDFVYFDGNHQKEATLYYFEMCKKLVHNGTVFYFDDINWSAGMRDAWKIIKSNPEVTLTVDLFQCGIVFFKKELSKQNFIIRY